MIYKFEGKGLVFMELSIYEGKATIHSENRKTKQETTLSLSKETLYDLIGALHSVQGKLNKIERGAYNV